MTSRPHALHLEPSQLFIREESGPDQNGAVLSSHLPEVDVLFCFCSRCWKFRALPVRKRGRDGRFKLNSPSWSWTDQSCIEVFFFFFIWVRQLLCRDLSEMVQSRRVASETPAGSRGAVSAGALVSGVGIVAVGSTGCRIITWTRAVWKKSGSVWRVGSRFSPKKPSLKKYKNSPKAQWFWQLLWLYCPSWVSDALICWISMFRLWCIFNKCALFH